MRIAAGRIVALRPQRVMLEDDGEMIGKTVDQMVDFVSERLAPGTLEIAKDDQANGHIGRTEPWIVRAHSNVFEGCCNVIRPQFLRIQRGHDRIAPALRLHEYPLKEHHGHQGRRQKADNHPPCPRGLGLLSPRDVFHACSKRTE